ncbi:MAG TPA: hypothetical protein VHS52_02510 [Acidimicrobiales bacterium]|nr:hypothetical protein [Acidimicrobiales bacterium]
MFRRKKKSGSPAPDGAEAAVTEEPAAAEGTQAAETTQPDDAGDAVAQVEPAPGDQGAGGGAIPFAETSAPVSGEAGVDDPGADDPTGDDMAPQSAEAVQRRRRYAPSDAPLAPPSGGEEHLPVSYWVGSVQSVLTKSGTSNPDDLQRQAAAEFQAAIMPGLMGLRDAVPDAESPDDALRVLAQREAEHQFPEDPEAGSLSQRDIFQTDASVYYRIRNRFEKPRRRVGWGDPWRPPPGLARPDPPHRALDRGN